jgi:30S ribosomal protein S31
VQVVEPAGLFLYNARQRSGWRDDSNLDLATKRKERMGKGDRRSKRGKIHRGTFGKTRLKKPKKKSEQPEAKSR